MCDPYLLEKRTVTWPHVDFFPRRRESSGKSYEGLISWRRQESKHDDELDRENVAGKAIDCFATWPQCRLIENANKWLDERKAASSRSK